MKDIRKNITPVQHSHTSRKVGVQGNLDFTVATELKDRKEYFSMHLLGENHISHLSPVHEKTAASAPPSSPP